MWVDHFVIHDDNFGPYLTLDTRALERDPTVRAEKILIVRRHPSSLSADMAEGAAAVWLKALPRLFEDDAGLPWLNLARRYRGAFVLRPVLLSREEYCEHLLSLEGHDESRLDPSTVNELRGLPETVWMVEISLPDLFTGNRAKLGEVIVDANVPDTRPLDGRSIVAARLPGRLLIADPVETSGDPAKRYGAPIRRAALTSHSPIYMRKQPDELW